MSLGMKHFKKQICIFKSAHAPFVGERAPLPEAQLPHWRMGLSPPREQLPGERTLECRQLHSRTWCWVRNWGGPTGHVAVPAVGWHPAQLPCFSGGQRRSSTGIFPGQTLFSPGTGLDTVLLPAHSSLGAPGCPCGPGAACDSAGETLHSLSLKIH